MERKTCKAVILNTDEAQGIVECIFSVFGILDFGKDIVHSGAFTKTWNERGQKIKLLDSHNTNSVLSALGKPLEFRELRRGELPQAVMDEYPEATGGAWAKVQFNMKTDAGRDAYWHVASGDVDEWSYGYDAVDKDHTKTNWRGQEVVARNLRGIKQYELSPCIFGMNEATTTTAAKAAPSDDDEDEYKATWSAAFVNDLPDSSFLLVESGGDKDEDGKTTPRSLRHLPYKNAEGDIDLPHLRNAISRLGQEGTGESGGEKWLSEDVRKRLLNRARGLLENANKSSKEMTEHGPMRRLGDVLQGSIHKIFTVMCDEWYTQGFMNRDERIALSSLIGDALEILAAGIPEELAMRSLQSHEMYYMSFDLEGEIKAGRVLSDRNAKRIKAAMAELHNCLMEAGLMEMPEDANTGPQKSETLPTSESASEAGPNEEDRTRYLKLIEIQQQALELLEV